VGTTETHRAIEAVFRIERARLIAGLARMVRDVGLAEELAQDALVTALSEWPKTGVPNNPSAWLMAAAKRRAIDGLRRDRMLERKHAGIERDLGMSAIPVSRTSKRPWTTRLAMSFWA
jgi:predicted RNA polymerase sigma factor